MIGIDKKRISMYKLFLGLSPDELNKVITCCTETSYAPGDVIIKESVLGINIYLVLGGEVTVEIDFKFLEGRQGLATLAEGDFFGEYCFLGNKPRTAQVTAASQVRVLKIDNHSLDMLFEKESRIGYVMMRNIAAILSERLSETNIKLRDKT